MPVNYQFDKKRFEALVRSIEVLFDKEVKSNKIEKENILAANMNKDPVIEIREAMLPDDVDFIRRLWIDYLTWANDNMQMFYGVHPSESLLNVEHHLELLSMEIYAVGARICGRLRFCCIFI